ncbi:MAG: thiazole synthase [Deltaproteobacteria bacterium]|nr:thiazole synthase [Deltaproteobacteria bacterium]
MTGKEREDLLVLADRSFSSRLLVGTGKYASNDAMVGAVKASGTQLVTLALRRFNPRQPHDDLLTPLAEAGVNLMPNTSGARNADEAVRAALIAGEASGSRFIKLEIHPNPYHLMPDPIETFSAADQLVKRGFAVLPYINADPVLAKRLEEIGCAAVMPLGAAIGSGQGIATRELIEIIIDEAKIPVIIDAGLRSPADAAYAMEMGADAVLVNTAIAVAGNPIAMAEAFKLAVQAGRKAYLAGIMQRKRGAEPTSPLTSFLDPE